MIKEQWERRYRLCLRFASFYDSEHRYDIVHDAWIYYLDKTEDDLFEIELRNESSFLYTVIKRAYLRWQYKERKGEGYQYYSTDILSGGFDNSDDQLIGKNLYDLFYRRLFEATKSNDKRHYRTEKSRLLPMEIFRLKANGYSQKDISDELQVSKQLVNQYIKKIEEMGLFQNPFNGSRTKVTKTLTELGWSKRKDHDEFELEDENEWYFLYVHKESKEGWLVKIKNPVNYLENLK